MPENIGKHLDHEGAAPGLFALFDTGFHISIGADGMTWLNRTHLGDCDRTMQIMAADGVRVHQVVTSPPYDKLRKYGDSDRWNFPRVAQDLFDILVPGGVVCWNVNDSVVKGGESLTSMRQALHFVDVVGFRMHDTMIWHKSNFANPERVRYHQMFEYVFVLSKGEPRCFNPIKDKPNATAGRIGSVGANTYSRADGSKSERPRRLVTAMGMRGNVWSGITRGQEEFCKKLPHPAMMAKWLARDLILSWSNPGDIVLDPFAGSGTTLTEAQQLGRRWIGCERYRKYASAKRRLKREVGMQL